MSDDSATSDPTSSFRKQVGLALLGGLFTVVVAPAVTFLIGQIQWSIEQKTFAERTRLETIAVARRDFLHAFSDDCWALQLAMIDVPFSRQFRDEEYNEACKRYDETSPKLFGKLRALSEGAVWFTADATQQKVDEHVEWLLGLDLELLQLRSGQDNQPKWKEFHHRVFTQTKSRTRKLIQELAEEFQLSHRSRG